MMYTYSKKKKYKQEIYDKNYNAAVSIKQVTIDL